MSQRVRRTCCSHRRKPPRPRASRPRRAREVGPAAAAAEHGNARGVNSGLEQPWRCGEALRRATSWQWADRAPLQHRTAAKLERRRRRSLLCCQHSIKSATTGTTWPASSGMPRNRRRSEYAQCTQASVRPRSGRAAFRQRHAADRPRAPPLRSDNAGRGESVSFVERRCGATA